jgi:hypothetical protein
VKIWSRSGDTCLADMYTPWSMYGWSMVSQGCSCLMLFVFVWWAKVAHVLCCCGCMVSQGCSCLMLFVFVWWAKVAHVLCCLCLYGESRLLISYVVCVCMASQGCSYLMLFVFVWWAKVAHVLCCLCLYVFVCVQWYPHKNDVQFVLSPVFLWFLSPVSSTVMSLWFFFFMFFAG